MPDNTVSFSKVTINRPNGPLLSLDFSKCDLCKALVLDIEEDMEAHGQWHHSLRREVGTAALGFGGLGFSGPL